jgi:hypothetical protein
LPSTPVAALASKTAATASVPASAEVARSLPNPSSSSVFDALTYASWDQLTPDRSSAGE